MDTSRIDWSQLWNPGPKRHYTADEMAKAGSDAPSPTLVAIALVNYGLLAFGVLQMAPPSQTARLVSALLAMAVAAGWAARWLWKRPWRRSLMHVSLVIGLCMILFAVGLKWRVPDPSVALPVLMSVFFACLVLWGSLVALVFWRSHRIEGRLRELAERDRSIEMARRLAAAQIEPHFLYNTLASVQHWVQTGDARAAPLLASLTDYLRATLPLFQREVLVAADELLAVQRYLEVMQARMGRRLTWRIDVDADAQRARLAPGMLLTLVENAVVHGLEPKLDGGRIDVRGHVSSGLVEFLIEDDGVGLVAGNSGDPVDGVGLANIRERLRLVHGEAADLQLLARAAGGCRALIRLPFVAP